METESWDGKLGWRC